MTERTQRIAAIIVAAGSSRRLPDSAGVPKQYRALHGVPLLAWTLRAFLDHPRIDRIVVALPVKDAENPPEWIARLPVERVAGGLERGDSVRNALRYLAADAVGTVLVHDGARPFVTGALIDGVLAVGEGEAVVPGLPLTDTVKEVTDQGFVLGTFDRTRFVRVQTPQAFSAGTLATVYERALADGFSATDDAGLFERYGLPVRVVAGDPRNLKITTPEDFALAEVLAHRLPRPS